jgi:cob(I)alamin adenosyltransferase
VPATIREVVRIYTRKGDDGTTGLLYGGRVAKSSPRIELNGAVDEAQAALGWARAESAPGSELDELLVVLERELYVLMAEVATAPANRKKLVPGESLVTEPMVLRLEEWIDRLSERFPVPTEFVVPGANRASAALDVARTVVRRAERTVASMAPLDEAEPASGPQDAGDATEGEHPGGQPSHVGPYLNRLSDLLWTMARWQEGEVHLSARERPRRGGAV